MLFRSNLLETAKQRLRDNMHTPANYDEFKKSVEANRGMYLCGWDGTAETEETIKAETKATLRCLPNNLEQLGIEAPSLEGLKDIYSGQPAKYLAIFARAY